MAGDAKWKLTAMGYSGVWSATDQVPLRAVESARSAASATSIDRRGQDTPLQPLGRIPAEPRSGVLEATLYGLK